MEKTIFVLLNKATKTWAQILGDDAPVFRRLHENGQAMAYDALTACNTHERTLMARNTVDRCIFLGWLKIDADGVVTVVPGNMLLAIDAKQAP